MIVLKCHTYRSAAKLLYTGWKVVWDKWPCDFWINVNCGDDVLCFYCILAEREKGGCTYWVSFLHLHACLFMCWGWPHDLSCYIWPCVIAFEYQTMTTQRYCLLIFIFLNIVHRFWSKDSKRFVCYNALWFQSALNLGPSKRILEKKSIIKIKFCMARTNIFFKILKIIINFENESISLNVYRRF